MRPLIERSGAEFRSYPDPMPSSKRISEALHEMINATMIFIELSENHTAWFIEEMRREKPDVIVYDTTAMWGYIAGRILNIPHICSVTHFVLEGSEQFPMAAFMRFLLMAVPKLLRIAKWKKFMKQNFGKENVGGITEFAKCNIVFTSKEFHPRNSI